jgi:ACS family D-galactonate transporter-like MFS transporter
MSTRASVLNGAAVAVKTRVRWKIFLLMLLLISINYIDRASLSVAMPLIG